MGHTGDFRYASDLVEFIRREHDGCFHIEVGCYPECHPQSDDAHADLRHFKRKVDAGANGAITQYFYNADRSEEHTSELQSLMRISYAVFCLKNKKTQHKQTI